MPSDLQLAVARQRSRHPAPLAIAAFAVAFVLALFLDVPLSRWAHVSGVAGWMKDRWWITHIIRFPGNFIFTVLMCAALFAAAWAAGIRGGSRLWTKLTILLLAAVLSGINSPMKWIVGRIRPYHGIPPFELHPMKYGLMHAEAGFSFPSGDASLAFAMAMSLTMTVPRLTWLWWTLAVIVGIERIAENAHYPSDVVAGAALGVAVAILAKKAVSVLVKK